MITRKAAVLLFPFTALRPLPPCAMLLLLSSIGGLALAQSQTTGRIAGTIKDEQGAVIGGAEVTVVSRATGDARKVTTESEGNYAVPLLLPGAYRVSITASGFKKALFDNVQVAITETTTINSELAVGEVKESIAINGASPLIQTDGPRLGRLVDSRAVSELPLATRNFTQILGLSPGASAFLPDNTAVGRNSQFVSVNGARVTQNSFQINGVDANSIFNNSPLQLAVPAAETIQEFKVQTSLYDATVGRSGGGNIQAVTKSGSNDFHGVFYEYFRHDGLNANNPFLKAAGVKRPILRRNIFGGLLGGPIQRDRAFFFISYQGTRERNGASRLTSLSSNILVAPGLTDDRSEETLLRTFTPVLKNGQPATSINPTALALLNVKLPNGQFLIPTPQANGRYSGSMPSRYQEDQFNANVDYRVNEKNWLAVKFFFANAPQTLTLPGGVGIGPNVPGFGADQKNNNRLISVQDVHIFSQTVINEARIGYSFIRNDSFPQEPVKDPDVGIRRSNADAFPGLPVIRLAGREAGRVIIGTAPAADSQAASASTTLADILSIMRGKHNIRTGAEIRYYESNFTRNTSARGQIDFAGFNDFLIGVTSSSLLATGIGDRSLRATDYYVFIQDDWKITPRCTLNLGLRYELDLPPYDTRGRISTFDPSLYKPRPLSDTAVTGLLVPLSGFVQAGNVIPQYDLPDVPNVGKRVLRSIDPNNFTPRLGFAYLPLVSGRLVMRGGYGIFYSRASFQSLVVAVFTPPYFVNGRRGPAPVADPFFSIPTQSQFPTFVERIALVAFALDRNIRTPYFHQYNISVQYELVKDMMVEVAYVGTRGLNLFRNVAINQARLASPQNPIINDVTGEVITANTPENAGLRAPFQGVETSVFFQNQTTAQSTYNSLQVSLTKRLSKGVQLLASYTYAKSMDNASGGGGGAGTTGVIDQASPVSVADTGGILGNQLNNRVNRGVSDFDRLHRFVLSYLWELPKPAFADRSPAGRLLLSNWQVAGIIVAMSGLPIDIVDSGAASLYGLSGGTGPLARPNWAPGATSSTATSNVPAGYFFNPFAFVRPVVQPGQPIPSSNGAATSGGPGSDIGNVGRNVLRGPRQTNVDFSIIKRFPFGESKNVEFRAEFFNLFNHVNLANPISDFNAIRSSGGGIDLNTGQIINPGPGDFGRIISTSNNPRIIQFALKFNY